MNSVIYQIMLADFLERIRRPGFRMTILFVIVLSYFFSPPRDGNYATLVFGHYVGVYNSAWMGTSVAISFSIFFSLIGFYLISNALDTDRRSGVGQIMAASSVPKVKYLFGKFFSNLAILCFITIITIGTAAVMQMVRGEHATIDIWELCSPFLFLVLPIITLVSAAAIWFEVIPWLHGTLGNILYFIGWTLLLFQFMGGSEIPIGNLITLSDPFGQLFPISSIVETLNQMDPQYNGQFSQGITTINEDTKTFIWNGVEWTLPIVFGRMLWVLIAVFSVWFASFIFGRFKRESVAASRKQPVKARVTGDQSAAALAFTSFSSASLSSVTQRMFFLPILLAELKLLLSGKRWWFVGAFLIIILGFSLPFEMVERLLWPLAWIWPLTIWSAMGSKEKQYRMEELLFAIPGRSGRQIPATWLAGVIVAMVISVGVAVRLMMEGQLAMLFVWFIGSLFIPTLALLCGVWSRGGKAFEVVYLVIWYLGPLNHLDFINFMDLHSVNNTIAYAVITVGMYMVVIQRERRKVTGSISI